MRVSRFRQEVLALYGVAETEERLAKPELREIVSVAVALGATETGGPLSSEEQRLVALTSPWRSDIEGVRESILQGFDPLGEAICGLRLISERRRLGTFYTPPPIIETMVAWALARKPVRLIDPGCGSGRFAARAIRQDPSLEVVAIDVDPLATLACRAVLATLGAKRSLVLNGDYMGTSLPAPLGRTAFVGNPPYVRHHRLTPEQKIRAKEVAAELGILLSGLSGLHVHFFLATLRHAREGDTGCFITSSEWLDVGYGEALRRALVDGMGAVGIHLVNPDAVVFDDAMATAVITCFEVGKRPSSVRVRAVASATQLRALGAGGKMVPLARLRAAPRWTPLFRSDGRPTQSGYVRLGDLARVSRGAVTGGNHFFVMSESESRTRGLSKYVVPALTSAREVLGAGGVVRADVSRRVVLDPPGSADLHAPENEALRGYLVWGQEQGVASLRLESGWFGDSQCLARVLPKGPAG